MSDSRTTVSPPPRGAATILIVDDEMYVTRVTQKILEGLGYRTLTATNGYEAVELVKTFDGDIHLVILDMGMPIMSGPEAFPLMMEQRPDLKVIVCSGYELDRSAQGLIDAGASSFLQKPFRKTELALAIKEALEPSELK